MGLVSGSLALYVPQLWLKSLFKIARVLFKVFDWVIVEVTPCLVSAVVGLSHSLRYYNKAACAQGVSYGVSVDQCLP